jgi:hypothetical protein
MVVYIHSLHHNLIRCHLLISMIERTIQRVCVLEYLVLGLYSYSLTGSGVALRGEDSRPFNGISTSSRVLEYGGSNKMFKYNFRDKARSGLEIRRHEKM